MALWGGRFSQTADEALRALNDSIGFDRRMYAEDIAGSIAYAKALAAANVLKPEEAQAIVAGLEQVQAEFDDEVFAVADGDEDIHSAVERRLTELIGPVAGKLHTGRSRNDQVATDFRLWVKRAVRDIDSLLLSVQRALVEQSESHVETLMPGYTHLQPAQPVTAAHWLMSYFWMLSRDRSRLVDALRRMDEMPLGSGALSGTPFDIDRASLAESLGFQHVTQNSLDAVSDRDFVAEVLFGFAMIGTHLSRLAEDLIIFSNPAFGFITLDDRYSTGSSLMPQKRNADPMELARGKASRLLGHLVSLLVTLKGLPSGYNKDLQEDKEGVFDAYDTLDKLLPVMHAVIETLHINPQAMRAGLQDEMLATELADYLVKKGVPFREAHHVVGQVVQLGTRTGISLSKLSLSALHEIDERFDEDVAQAFDFEAAVMRRQAVGGTAPSAVREQIKMARQQL